ncbi:ubiquitin-conjugating enzyme E2S [Tribonema minus]|uniref:E2 ubiquitin-conjugating enzyme n=1 Tax=Tribonema minus TaxID=303371 RepID=A0A836CAV4_9STRA|nr:ubiquitin-conjugating enzyme E2S [Tribonema minus]
MASNNCENFSPQTISRLHREVGELARASPEGCTFVPSETDNIAEIMCDIEGPVGTPYEGGSFRVKLVLSSDYPSSPPRGFFLTRIYHPNVGPTGDICVNTLKKDWTQAVTMAHIFQVIRCLLIVPFPESSLNDEAGKLFMESYEEFSRRARLMTSVHAAKNKAAAGGCCGGAGSSDGSSALAAAAAGEGSVAAAALPAAEARKIAKAKDGKKKALRRL